MSPWLRTLLGLEEGEIPQEGIARLEFAGMPQGWWAVAAFFIVVLAVGLVVLIYRRESELSRVKRVVLTALRVGALALLVLVLLNPRIAVEIQARRPARTVLLADGSGSMNSVDRYDSSEGRRIQRITGLDMDPWYDGGRGEGPTRAQIVAAALERSSLVEELSRNNQVRCYSFGEGIEAVDAGKLPAAVLAAPQAKASTWIGTALREAVDAAGAQLVAGLVLISDGRSSGGESLTGAQAELEARGIPVHVLGVGKLDIKKNITIADVKAPEVAETGLPLRVQVRVRSTGYPGDVQLTLSRALSGERSYRAIAAETITLREFASEEIVNFTDVPPRDGRYHYLAEIEPQPGEEKDWDNRRRVDVVVASEGCRVLLIAGSPNFEYRYVRNFFIRDPGVQISCWLQSADPRFPQEGDLTIRSLPGTLAELRPYDVVVMLDPDSLALPDGFGAVLQQFVADLGGGLAFVAGEHHTARLAGSAEGKRLLALLPVHLGNRHPGHNHRQALRVQLTAEGVEHPICQFFGTRQENLRLWAVLPKFYFRFPVQGIKPAASALWMSGGDVVLAGQQPGAGRVLFVATDDLYRWREYQEGIHEQFWSSTVRFLALGKRLAGTRKVSLVTDRERYLLGDEVRIEAHILDSSHEPLVANQVVTQLERVGIVEEEADGGDGESSLTTSSEMDDAGDPREVFLDAIEGRPGWFRGRIKVAVAGSYRLSLADSSAEGLPAAFVVQSPSGEFENTAPDFSALEALARGTGGSFGLIPEIRAVPKRIPDRTVYEVLGRKTATVWDSATLLLVFAGFLALEWILRKRWQLC